MGYKIVRVTVTAKVPDAFADALREQLESALAGFAHSKIEFTEDDPRETAQALGLESPDPPKPARPRRVVIVPAKEPS